MANHGLVRRSCRDHERRGNLPDSVTKRRILLVALSRWLGERSPLDAEKDYIERFLDGCHIGNSTPHTWVSDLHCFYAWAISEDLTLTDQPAKINRPKLRRHLPRPANTRELADALAITCSQSRCWIMLAAFQGLRVQEIAGLDCSDIDEMNRLRRVVHGNGDKELLLRLHLQPWESLRMLPLSGVVFHRPKGGMWSLSKLSEAFNTELKDHDVGAHQLRHWFDTTLNAGTHGLRLTQEMVGHSSTQTTAIYTAFDRASAAMAVAGLTLAS